MAASIAEFPMQPQDPRDPPVLMPDARERLDDYVEAEKNGADLVAIEISKHLYGRPYDELPPANRRRVEAMAVHAIRGSQLTWNTLAAERATAALDQAMCRELGMPYAGQPFERRRRLAIIGMQIVDAGLRGVLDLEHPFDGPGQALKVYDKAEEECRQVMQAARKGGR